MINAENSLILIVDIQEKLVNMLEKDTISGKAAKLLQAGKILGIPAVITEQYPKGLGTTLDSLKQEAPENTKFFEKTSFSAMREEDFPELLKESGRKKILIGGIETHICVYQTVSDLLEAGYEVEVIKDITASRSKSEYNTGLERMKQLGAGVTSFETLLFEFLKSSKHPNFKEIQGLIKD